MADDGATMEKYLQSKTFTSLEEEIARLTRTVVLKDHFILSIEWAKKNLANAGLGLEIISSIIDSNQEILIKFGVQFLTNSEACKNEEEYPIGEEPEEHEKSKVLASLGLSTGFGIQYAIYYHYLSADDITGLIKYLKLSRIPGQKKFAKQLQGIFTRLA
jgi:hypothetical protein